MLICTTIREKSQAAVLKRLNALNGKVDLAEIWLDQICNLDAKTLLKNPPLPVLCVCKRSVEKGAFKGTYKALAEVLTDACRFSASYVDIPLEMPKSLNKKIVQSATSAAAKKRTKIIISYHNFKKTPSNAVLLKKALEMKARGADIIKIATKSQNLEDTFAIISLAQVLQSKKIPHILIAMGKKGILSRVLTPFLGGTIMFAPLTSKEASASGQLTVKELKKALSLIDL